MLAPAVADPRNGMLRSALSAIGRNDMPVVRTCTICHMSKQKIDRNTMQPVDGVMRYGLYRSVAIPGRTRTDTKRYRTDKGCGGIDLCTECWEKHCAINKKNTRHRS